MLFSFAVGETLNSAPSSKFIEILFTRINFPFSVVCTLCVKFLNEIL